MKRHPTMLRQAKEYLLLRRRLGFKMQSQGEMLFQFAKYLDRSGHRGPFTTEMALRWAIAMWLGHETTQTTHQYLDADLEAKKRALACLEPPRLRKSRQSGADGIVQFLKGL